ncbi:MAG: NAD-dependent epimerase [Bacteroidetes bacterium SW_9_63_38]|nr:MAG: NAD-dependent epimerase [Bacteroidetes bacterium SW_9_63_38]
MKQIAFVTGGTGFVGSHLVEELLRREFGEVRCLVRTDPKWLSDLNVTYVRGDLSDVEALWTALDGVTHVYHTAGLTRAPDWEPFYEVNVQGTLNLMGAVKHAAPDLERVLVTSSLAAVGRCEAAIATEKHPLQPVSRYGRSKAEMEEALHDAHNMTESYWNALPITIVRPAAVYGPRDDDILDFFRAVQRHFCPIVGSGSKRTLSLVHVHDLATGIVDASLAPSANGETYLLGSDRPYAWNEIKQAATDALDTWAVSLPIPPLLVGAVGILAGGWGTLTGTYPPLNRDKARELRHACTACTINKAAHDFDYTPNVPLAQGVATTIDWYRDEGWL